MKSSAPRLLAVPALAAMLLAGCATPQRDTHAPTGPGATPGESSAIDLVGMWRVSDAAGESESTWLRLDVHEFMLWRDCVVISGSWSAGEQLFIAGVHSAMGGCVTGSTIPEVPWLESVASYRASVGGWELLDASGDTVASLTIDGKPAPHPDIIDYLTEAPEITDETREHFRGAVALPAGLDAPTIVDLEGRWNPVGEGEGTDAHAQLAADGTYTASDGCNGTMGRWAIGAGGEWLATAGPSTLIACEGAPVAFWLSQAKRAGMDGAQLVLLDADGAELGRLAR